MSNSAAPPPTLSIDRRRAPKRRYCSLCCLILVTSIIAGCSAKSKRRWDFTSLEETMRVALPADLANSHPDDRRHAVARLAEEWSYDRDDVFQVLDAVARTDPVTQIRCIAIRGLGRYRDDRPVPTLLKILRAREDSTEALPANDDVRWESTAALLALAQRDVLTDEAEAVVRDIAIRYAEFDRSRSVRLTTIELLSMFRDRRVLAPLIRVLREEDFALAERAELSLIALTGVTHDFDADAWESWVANTDDPFASAGQMPQTTRPAAPSWWEKQQRAVRRALKLPDAD